MIKRIYIDNYKCLVNFEFKPGPINLLLGPNGGGKSTVFEVLACLKLVIKGENLNDVFKPRNLTIWQDSRLQTFEIDIADKQNVYRYELCIEYDKPNEAKNKYEKLWLNSKPLVICDEKITRLYREDFSEGHKYPSPANVSSVSYTPADYNKFIYEFINIINRIYPIQIVPISDYIEKASFEEQPFPSKNFLNFQSWYRYQINKNPDFQNKLADELMEVLPGYMLPRFENVGLNIKQMILRFRENSNGEMREFSISELSDGQRALLFLYSLIVLAEEQKLILLLDEPENYVALPEIQPILVKLFELCDEGNVQAVIISHHPEVFNYLLSSPVGYWFERQDNRQTRIKSVKSQGSSGLPVSELIARGWLDE